jgi:hypothetical protein
MDASNPENKIVERPYPARGENDNWAHRRKSMPLTLASPSMGPIHIQKKN